MQASASLLPFGDGNEPGLACFHSTICSSRHHVMAKTAISIEAFLLDDHFVGEEGHRNFALRRIARNKRRDIPDDGGFANRFTDVRITTAGHPFTIELNFKSVVPKRKHAKVVAQVFVYAINLRGGDSSTLAFLSRQRNKQRTQQCDEEKVVHLFIDYGGG